MSALLEAAKEKLQSLRNKQREQEQQLAEEIFKEEQIISYYRDTQQRVESGRLTVARARAFLDAQKIDVNAVIDREFNRVLNNQVSDQSIEVLLAEVTAACHLAEAQKHHARILEKIEANTVTQQETELANWIESNKAVLRKHGLVK